MRVPAAPRHEVELPEPELESGPIQQMAEHHERYGWNSAEIRLAFQEVEKVGPGTLVCGNYGDPKWREILKFGNLPPAWLDVVIGYAVHGHDFPVG